MRNPTVLALMKQLDADDMWFSNGGITFLRHGYYGGYAIRGHVTYRRLWELEQKNKLNRATDEVGK